MWHVVTRDGPRWCMLSTLVSAPAKGLQYQAAIGNLADQPVLVRNHDPYAKEVGCSVLNEVTSTTTTQSQQLPDWS